MGSGGVVAEISSPDVSVVFTNGDGKYAFDAAPTTQNGKLNKTYASLPQKSGGTYNVPFKAISNSPYEKDVIVATVDFKNGKTKKTTPKPKIKNRPTPVPIDKYKMKSLNKKSKNLRPKRSDFVSFTQLLSGLSIQCIFFYEQFLSIC